MLVSTCVILPFVLTTTVHLRNKMETNLISQSDSWREGKMPNRHDGEEYYASDSDGKDDFSDEGLGCSVVTLNYSKEDIRALATKAELMVLDRIEKGKDTEDDDDDDLYFSRRKSVFAEMSSLPDLPRRSSPRRKVLHGRRRDWRNSLPESLEFYNISKERSSSSDDSQSSDGDNEIQERVSAPELSELWEDEQYLSEVLTSSDEKVDNEHLPSLLSFGEDYGRFLTMRMEDSDSSIDNGKCVENKPVPPRKEKRKKADNKFANDKQHDNEIPLFQQRLKIVKENLTKAEMNFDAFKIEESSLIECDNNLKKLQKLQRGLKGIQLMELTELTKEWKQLQKSCHKQYQQSLDFREIQSNVAQMQSRLKSIQAENLRRSYYHESKEEIFSLGKKLLDLTMSVQKLVSDVSSANQSRLSLVYRLRQEVSQMHRDWEQTDFLLLQDEEDRKPLPLSRRFAIWGFTSSLVLLSILSFGSMFVAAHQPQCCSDNFASWSFLANPITFSYVNGPPPI